MTEKDQTKRDVEKMLSPPGEAAPGRTSLNQVTIPTQNAGENLGSEEVKLNAAQLVGRNSDQVLTGSPAAEYGSTGLYALDGMIEESKRLAKEKYQAMQAEKNEVNDS